ncbi:MAG: cysteine--tRNA ligase [Dehalococcoidales bacterium]|nr:cysteine--tRNA ligase [Dehalococcoidales bacterium]
MKVFNTLSGMKEEFVPRGNEVKMYVCGVTPYADSHIGHAMSYVIFDVIRRYLQFKGYKVKYVQNITDIDDKLIDRAGKLGSSVSELAQRFTASYFEDMDALNVGRVDIYPRATEEIDKIIEVIGGLIDMGYAYPAGGSVYFRVGNVPDYGKLSHRSLEAMMAGGNVDFDKEKENSLDFALWKAAKPGEPWWESPWGRGRPGWHIECSAMSLKYLGDTIDIHGGGQDLVFPHHENEIAQSESFTGKKPFVKYWLHNGMVQFGNEKMSKSLGNLITIKDALTRHSADAIRIFILNSHYRSPLTYLEESFEAAEKAAERLQQAARSEATVGKGEGLIDIDTYRSQFVTAMDDDFNTARALATLFDLAREINRAVESGYRVAAAQQMLVELSGILGLTLKPSDKPVIDAGLVARIRDSVYQELDRVVADETVQTAEGLIEEMISLRNQLRQAKEWQLADMVRSRLDEAGIILEDTTNGTVAKYRR